MLRRIRHILTNRIVVITFLLLLQLALFSVLLIYAGRRSVIFSGILKAVSILVVLYIINRRDKPAYKITWTALILVFPLFGGLMYLIFKLQSHAGGFKSRQNSYEEESKLYLRQDAEVFGRMVNDFYSHSTGASYLKEKAGYPVYSDTRVEYLSPGESFFEHLIPELEKAEKYIFLEFFIVSKGKMWDKVLDVLERKAAEGVDVRLIYDDIGSIFNLSKDYDAFLCSKGITTTVFNPFIPFWNSVQNNRNHRKIIVIDGKTAYTGGANIGDEYINEVERFGYWKDSMVFLEGDAVWPLTVMFLEMWNCLRKTNEDYNKYKCSCPKPAPHCYVQPYGDSPLTDENIGEHVYMQIINAAKDYVYIETPYLVPDENMLSCLTLAAKSGVDVRIIMPHKPDKWLVYMTGRSYYPQLIEAGVKIYEYLPGFVHSKVFVSDDKVSTVGTVNLDYRSLYLHYECGAVIYGTDMANTIKSDYLKTLENCRMIKAEEVTKNLPGRMLQAALRVCAPLM